MWGLWKAFGSKTGEMKLLNTPFSQFVKGSTQLVYGHRLGLRDIWLRAFTVRSRSAL